ncbi:MAG: DinB family protein [Sphingobacteriales bacterium]|nr:DinB family protein [Sphingobacteriales bacterium]
MKTIAKPTSGVPDFYQHYIDKVPNDGLLLQHLDKIMKETNSLIGSLSEDKLLFRYAPGKWTIKDLMLHLADCERVIIYRAMRFSRGDKTDLPGFDEELFVNAAHANDKPIAEIIEQLNAYRTASILFIKSLSDAELDNGGTANGYPITARLLVNHLYGHHKHHLDIIKERYL